MTGAVLLKILFWLFFAIDALCIGLFFVLGLAAAGSAKTHPLAVAVVMLVVPGALVAGAAFLFVRSPSPGWRLVATLVVCAPAIALAVEHVMGVISLMQSQGGIVGSTPLTRALEALSDDPGQLAVVKDLLAKGADPNRVGEDVPLRLAIYAVRKVGLEPVRLLLEAGADPNQRGEFGDPAWYSATGNTIDLAVLEMVLARGADVKSKGQDGRGGLWSAVDHCNWPAAKLLLERGADWRGHSPMGLTMLAVVEGHAREHGGGGGVAEVLALLRARVPGK